jgi:hypothetical protein
MSLHHGSLAVFISAVSVTINWSTNILVAQAPEALLPQAEYCKKQQATLAARNSGSDYTGAIGNVRHCQLAAQSLAAQWNRKHTDITALQVLAHTSPLIRDQELFEAAARVANDATRSRNERLAAFIALAGYYDPTFYISYTDRLDQPGLTGFSYVWLGRSDASTMPGTTPLRSDARGNILRILTQAANSDGDSTIRSIALFLSEELRRE